ncbi:hypothetical protein [Jiangella mangrovi]|uniref:Uncharacterized protein n=1 Tax=Jiangella mangrovi TaxID=1524084 RepID=A0A7W9GLZ4_9ACTN|nr:hypothetical protein [Jiangella mangrovi]MBB5786320.1 hypothetical protein [Jiangella mangrovi]
MTGDFDDELRRRLGGLSADLDGVSLPGPSAARQRAARRTRHQVTGGVLAGVAAVAAGVAIISPPDLSTTPDPAPPASLSTPQTTDPATTTSAPAVSAALLTPEDLTEATAVDWQQSDEPGPAVACDPSGTVDTMSALTDRAQAGFASESGEVRQDLVRFVDGASAAGLRDELLGCLPERGADALPAVTDTVRLGGVGDEGWMVRYYADPDDDAATVATVAIVRSRDVVSVTVKTETTADTVGERALDMDVPVAAAERICDVLFGDTCVDEPFIEPMDGPVTTEGPTNAPTGDPTSDPTGDPTGDAEPEVLSLADDPFLTDDDVAAVGTATGFFRSPESTETTAHQAPCLEDLTAVGADTVEVLGYIHDLDASLAEWALQLPDADTAFRVVAAHTALPETCGEVGEDREQTVGDPVTLEVDGADDAIAWTVTSEPTADNAGSSGSFSGVGIARVSNIVVVVSFGAMDDPSGGDWPGVVTPLLATALERAVG